MSGLCGGKLFISTLFLVAVTMYSVSGQDCTVPSFNANLLTPSLECLPQSSISIGTSCMFVCDEGYTLIGNDTVDCIVSTSVLELPSCQASTTLASTPKQPTTQATAMEPSTTLATTAEPSTILLTITEPSTTQSTTLEPSTTLENTREPSTTQSTTLEPLTILVTITETSTTQATITEPSTTEATTTEPSTTQGTTAEPSTTQATKTEPSTTQATTAEQSTILVTITETSTTQDTTTEPSTTQETTTEPSTTQATTTEPSTTQASSTEPSTTQATTTEPSTTQATTTEPSTTQASTTEPSTTQTITTEPSTTQATAREVPTTQATTREVPTTQATTREVPTTQAATTEPSTTQATTTEPSTTQATTREVPTTQATTTEPSKNSSASTTVVVCTLPETFPSLLSSSSADCIAGSSIDYATTCHMECSMGYMLIGNQTITCQSEGALSDPLPNCDAVDTYIVFATFLNKTFNSSLTDRGSSYFIQIVAELVNYIQGPLRNRFTETVSVTVNSLSAGSVIAEFSVVIDVVNRSTLQDMEHLSTLHATLVDIAEVDPTYMDPDSIRTFSTVTCPAGTVVTAYGSIAMFESGAIHGRANSTNATCPYFTERGDQAVEGVCVGDYTRACNWVIPEMSCGRNLTAEEIIEILKNVEITSDNAANVAEELEDVTSMGQNISLEGLNVVAELLEDINGINSTETKVTGSIVEIADNIAALPDEQLGMAEEENSSPSRVVLAVEAQLAVVEVENGSSRFVETNIAAEVLDVNPDDISQGYTVFMAVTDDGESISDEGFNVKRGDLTQEPEATQAQATLFIPSGLADKFSGRRGRLVITTYRVPSLFQDTGIAQFNKDVDEFNRTLNSRIISASINNEKVEDLSEPVRISFTPVNPNGTNAQCVFWDFDDKAWSQRGCNKTSNDSSDRIECECNHLTNFGVLMDIYGGKQLSVEADFILEIVSYVGCLISIWGLVLTILTYATNKKLRHRKPNQILLSLSCALLGLYVVFLVMISVDTERDVTELSPLPCAILAAFLQYFTLAAIFWMAVEGFNMHNLFVLVLNTYLPRFMKKASLIAWGCPLLIVGITACGSRQYYAQTDFCFPAFWPLIGGLLIPIGVVMIFNFVIYVRVLMRLNKTMKGRHLDKTEKRQRIRRFQNAVCIMILMGLTWSLGYLTIIQPASAVVQGIFTVLNSLQGYFIFMLYCVRQPQVRRIWRSQFKCCLPKSFTTPSAVSSGSGQPSSTFKNSSARPDAGPVSNSDSSGFRPERVRLTLPERLPRASYDNAGAEV